VPEPSGKSNLLKPSDHSVCRFVAGSILYRPEHAARVPPSSLLVREHAQFTVDEGIQVVQR
jgi:hypothetical protein